ncbi:polyadenylate-binding protein 1-B-binding protein [Thalictrum thalictroides]|uniref:Polyadenylate-binding protein 1-B-binding protein n=1 Tax=Thalictrum thalictroides TaxID=46969 RepID=A0A7J6V5G0_THATH|nr:polyadenylate-binding protein 1-B-binding protein [Thalictrum thalictroides]
MDREPEELQFIGFFGVYKEAYKIVFSWRKIFTEIALGLILPLSFLFLAHIYISELLFGTILRNETALDYTRTGSPRYNRISDRLSSEWITFWLFKAVYLLFVLILSLLSTSAVVYTIACIYTAKDLTFKKVLSVVPKVWKRLMITFLWNFTIMFVYNFAAIVVVVLCVLAADALAGKVVGLIIMVLLLIVYLAGFVYINVIWHLASVVSVLEDMYGLQAMKKSKELIKGKMGLGSAIYVTIQFCILLIQFAFEEFVIYTDTLTSRVIWGIICFFLLSSLILLGLVVQTVVYFICKSYRHESIDKSCLSDHLEVYLGDYTPLKGRDVQLEQFDI